MSRGNILVVDETPANLRLLAEMLTRQGHMCASARWALSTGGPLDRSPREAPEFPRSDGCQSGTFVL